MNDKLEITFEMWKRWQTWIEENRAVNEAAEDPESRYHRMAVPVKMNRKRLRGLLMASGVQPRKVDAYLKLMNSYGYSYMEIWDKNKYTVVSRIIKRTEAMADSRLLHALFGDKPAIDYKKRKAFLQEILAKKKAKYEADKALIDAHPEIRSLSDAFLAKVKYLMSCSTLKEDGERVLEPGDFDMDRIKEFGRLSTWYSFTEWVRRNCRDAG